MSKRSSKPLKESSLPFVSAHKGKIQCWWDVPPTDDYGAACKTGKAFADAYVEYLVSGDEFAVGSGGTRALIADMAQVAQRTDASGGYAVGFFSRLEHYLAAGYYDLVLGSSRPAPKHMKAA